jgi:transcriptional regulator with XRE-family HTH domain
MGFAERLGELLAERGISGRELARRVPCDRSYVSLLAQGRRRPSPEMAARIDQLLGAGGQLAALAVRAPAERFADSAEYADARYVDELRESSQALVRLDTMYGGGDVLPLALRSFRTAAGLLATGGYAPAAGLDLQAAVGEAGEVAAWVAYDTDQNDLSRQLIHEALLASRLAGDREMELFELSHLAMLDTHVGRPREALRISVHALESGPLPDRVASVFEIRRGRALAQLGDGPGGVAAIRRARALADGDGPGWTWWVDEPELTLHEGQALGEAGNWKAAVPYMERAADQVIASRPRDSYVFSSFLLNAQARAGTWQDAGPVLARLTGLSGMVSSARTVTLLRAVTRHLAATASPGIAEAARELAGGLRN